MSYFFAGFNVHDKSKIEEINSIYANYIPLDESLSVNGSSAFAKLLHQNKIFQTFPLFLSEVLWGKRQLHQD